MGEPSGAQGLQARRERVVEVQWQELLQSELHSAQAQQPESRPSQFEAARRRPYLFAAAPVRLCRSSAGREGVERVVLADDTQTYFRGFDQVIRLGGST